MAIATDYVAKDGFFGKPYIDIDEERSAPVAHRYVHGGFEGTDTRFSFYFPPVEQYRERVLMIDVGGPGGSEHVATAGIGSSSLAVAFDAGCYLVETNQGHLGADMSGIKDQSTVLQWRANAEATRFSRAVARQIYGRAPRFGYAQAERALHALENAPDVFHGAVSDNLFHMSQGTFFSMLTNALRVLGPQLTDVADAMSVGGSGDPFAALDSEQREALALLYRTGFPRGAEFWLLDSFESAIVVPMNLADIQRNDPQYFADFWQARGYAGHDVERLALARSRSTCKVMRVVTAAEIVAAASSRTSGLAVAAFIIAKLWNKPDAPVGIVVDAPPYEAAYSSLAFTSGAARDQEVFCCGALGDVLLWNTGPGGSSPTLADIRPGDELVIDNSKYLAYCYWYRHQVDPEYPQWHALMVDGKPLYAQRPRREPMLSGTFKYAFDGKLIVVRGAMDAGVWPCGAAEYHARIQSRYGEGARDKIRLYWLEHAAHGTPAMMPPGTPPVITTRLIDHQGAAHQALLDLIAWVEHDTPPPPSTNFTMTEHNRLVMPSDPAARGGIQPIIAVTANGAAERVDVRVGEPVRMQATVTVPDGAGVLSAARWDFDGRGRWPTHEELPPDTRTATFQREHTFEQPGTYFPALWVSAQREGLAHPERYQVHNLGRIRIVVT